MAKRIPVSAAKEVAERFNCRQVILLAWDGELTHVVTYGKSADDCSQAATGGNMLKQKWGWPECNDQPSRVKKLERKIAQAEGKLLEFGQQWDAANESYVFTPEVNSKPSKASNRGWMGARSESDLGD